MKCVVTNQTFSFKTITFLLICDVLHWTDRQGFAGLMQTFLWRLNYYNLTAVDIWLGHSGRAVWGVNRFRHVEHWDRGFESHSRHGCLCPFILFVLFFVQVVALRRADPPSKESYRLCIKRAPWLLVRKRTIPTEWPPLVGEVSANFCG
jgi:hypothetical protein